MSASAALLRLLLSLVLVLNGIGTVAAFARMAGAMDGAAGAHHAAASKPALAKHCAHDAGAEATDLHAGHGNMPASPPCGDHATPDCCDSSACGCACAQSGSGALFAIAQLPPVFPHGDPAPPPSTGHAAPVLALAIRPPIA